MKPGILCIESIKRWESFRSSPYLDTGGVWTIGYGTIMYPNGKRVKKTDPAISEPEAEKIMLYFIMKFAKGVDAATRDDITQNQFDALCSFAYNVGIDQFRRSTLLRIANLDPNNKEIRRQFMRWVYDDGKLVAGLRNRRKYEADMYFSHLS